MRADKKYSQNFLKNELVVEQILRAMNLQDEDRIIEVGPGEGALTFGLSRQCQQLVALEIDQRLVTKLQQQFKHLSHVSIVHTNALKFSYHTQKKVRLVSNLPYHISTALIRKFLDAKECIVDMHLMMQKEVAQRLLCTQGRIRGWLSVMIELLCESEYLFDVSPDSFHPKPKVESAVIRLIPKLNDPLIPHCSSAFEAMLMQSFKQKRKTLLNNFSQGDHRLTKSDWQKIDIDPSQRAEQLSLEQFMRLYSYVQTI